MTIEPRNSLPQLTFRKAGVVRDEVMEVGR